MLFCAAFAAVGYALNAVRIPMFAEVGLHLGGAIAFLAAAAYGSIAGALVAAVAFAGCFFPPAIRSSALSQFLKLPGWDGSSTTGISGHGPPPSPSG
jgi:hypothetical protein